MSVTDVGFKGPELSARRNETVSNDYKLEQATSGRVALTSQNLLHLF